MKQELRDLLFIGEKFVSKRSRKEYFIKHDRLELFNHIKDKYDETYSIREVVMMYLNDIEPKICKICKNPSLSHILNGTVTMSNYCSNKCKNKDMAFIMKDIIPMRDEKSAQKKREETLLAKTGFKYNSQRPDLKHLWNKSKLPEPALELLTNKEWLYNQYKILKKSSQEIAKDLGIFYGSVLNFIDKHDIERNEDHQGSFQEVELANEIKKFYDGKIILNDKTVLKPKHIDIYFPDKNFGIEIDGIYWHSSPTKETSKEMKNYHKDKTDMAWENGVFLVHFTDRDIKDKLNLVLSMIKSRLGLTTKIHARKCNIEEITPKECKEFMEKNHMSGCAAANINIGLFFKNELIQVVSFKKPRFSTEANWELVRFATKSDSTIVGGFSKLLTYFKSMHGGTILSYCDKRYGSGKVYETTGFKHIRTSEPGYRWVRGEESLSRYSTQKLKLKKLLGAKYIKGTEDENMFNAKYRKIWDCGNKVFILDK